MSPTPTNAKAPRVWIAEISRLRENTEPPEALSSEEIHVIEASYAKELEVEIERLKKHIDSFSGCPACGEEFTYGEGKNIFESTENASLTEKLAVAEAALEDARFKCTMLAGRSQYSAEQFESGRYVLGELSENLKKAIASIRGNKNG